MAGFTGISAAKIGHSPMAEVLRVSNFRMFWIGETVSLFGNQFYIVAFPWLVLRMTDSGIVLGTLFMTIAVPRAIFMLVAGAATDRLSPRAVMVFANGVRGAVMALIAFLVFANSLRVWQLYSLAAVYGIFDAFFFPAYKALLPRIVSPENLQAGNALLQGSSELALSVGPASIGWLLGFGLALQTAIAIDALSFWFSVLTLLLLQVPQEQQVRPAPRVADLLRSIQEGISYSLKRPYLCAFTVNIAVLNFAMVGPFGIGIAVLAKEHFGSTTSFGILFSAIAIGALLGNVIAGLMRGTHSFRAMLILMAVNTGIGVILLGLVSNLAVLAVVLGWLGCINAVTGIVTFSQVQRMVEPEMMGRVMSLVMMGRTGIAPISYLFAGLMVRFGVRVLFLVSGAVVLVASALTLTGRGWLRHAKVPKESAN